jgi:maleamate amidohydrolase
MSGLEGLDENYARAGYHTRQQWGSRPALILVDFAQAYFDPSAPLFGGEGCSQALKSALALRELAHELGHPVILTEVIYRKGGADGGVFFRKAPVLSCFLAGSSTQRYADGLTPRDDDWIVSRQYPSAFFGTSLAATLTANGVDTLVITGLTTSGCVRATCVDSMSHGFITLVVRDAVGDRDPRPHEANLYDMNAKYADVVPETEAAGYLRSTAAARSPTKPRSANAEQREGS